MRSLSEWFGSGLKIKRWLFLVLIGTFIFETIGTILISVFLYIYDI